MQSGGRVVHWNTPKFWADYESEIRALIALRERRSLTAGEAAKLDDMNWYFAMVGPERRGVE